MKRKWILIGAGLLALAALVVISVRAGAAGDAARAYAEPVARRDITQTVRASGQIDPRVKVNISAHVVGKIERLYVREGDRIEAGAPFLQLERQAFQAVRDDARARKAIAETERRQAEVALADQRVRLDRARRLRAEGIASAETLESAELQHSSAELRLAGARQSVAQADALLVKAEDDLRKTTIFAPLAGRVVALNAEEGEVVVSGTMNNPASVIGTIADLSEVLVEVDVDETEVIDIRPGLAATVAVDAVPEVEYDGEVVEVGSSGYSKPTQPDVQFFRVKVLLQRPDERLRPGMSARAEIRVTTHAQALVVPIQAVVERPPLPATKPADTAAAAAGAPAEERPAVFALVEGKARQHAVETGISDATHVEIVAGLTGAETVITGPYRALKKLRDGDRVKKISPRRPGAPGDDGEANDEDS